MNLTVTPIFIEFPKCSVEPNRKALLMGLVLPRIIYFPDGESFTRVATLEEFEKFVDWDSLRGSGGNALENGEILMLKDFQVQIQLDGEGRWDYKILPKGA